MIKGRHPDNGCLLNGFIVLKSSDYLYNGVIKQKAYYKS